MLKISKMLGVWITCLATLASARADTPSTSVMCSWGLLVSISAMSRACSYDPQTEMSLVLEESIARLDQFILNHSDLPNTRELLEKKKQEAFANWQDRVSARPESCDPSSEVGAVRLYQHFADQGPAKLRAEIDKELAKPRSDPLGGVCP